MPHSLFKKSSIAFLAAALLAVNVVQVQTVFAEATYSADEAKTTSGFLGKKIEGARDLVALIVDQEVWNDSTSYDGLSKSKDNGSGFLGLGGVSSGDLRGRVERYAEDIQKALPKTQVLILPVSKEPQTVLKVQQVLERLYQEGDPDNSSPTQLKGVVMVGEVPLPVVHKGGQFFMSLLPYTDFVEPEYVFAPTTQTFERSNGVTNPKPEIWHGVIRAPGSGVDGKKQLAEYFDKNHLYHTGDKAYNNFQKKVLINDMSEEAKSLNSSLFPRYQNFLKNIEDLAYSRYSSKWLTLLKKKFDLIGSDGIGALNAEVAKLDQQDASAEIQKTPEEQAVEDQYKQDIAKASAGGNAPNSAKSTDYDAVIPDIQTMAPIQKYHLQYPELFGNFLNKVTDWATGSGRWGESDVESPPSIIAKKDLFMMEYFKSINDSIEAKINEQLEKIQKPQRLNRSVAVTGSFGGTVVNQWGLSNGKPANPSAGFTPLSIAVPVYDQNGQPSISYPNNNYSNPVKAMINILFINGSLALSAPMLTSLSPNAQSGAQEAGGAYGSSFHTIHGINFLDLNRAQQCSLYSGSQQKQVIANGYAGAVPQMVKFIRSLNIGTINQAAAAASTPSNFKDPRRVYGLGIHARTLTQAEAKKLTGNIYDHGARIEPDLALPIPAFDRLNPPGGDPTTPSAGDIILALDGTPVNTDNPFDSILSTYSSYGGVKVSYLHVGTAGPLETKMFLRDVNDDGVAAGCYGINFQNQLDVESGKTDKNGKLIPRHCYPELATSSVADHAGTVRVSDSATIADVDGLNACTNFSGYELFAKFYAGVRDVLKSLRAKPGDPITEPLNSHDPSKMILVQSYENKNQNIKTDPVTMQDFLNLYGVMNGVDENGDYFDTNSDGKTQQIQWRDLNGNGKMDLWLNYVKTWGVQTNQSNPASNTNQYTIGEDLLLPPQAFAFLQDKPESLDAAEFKTYHPELFQGDRYIGKPTAEFLGGDYGVDDPTELPYPFKPAGSTENEKWQSIVKAFLDTDTPRTFQTSEFRLDQSQKLVPYASITFTPNKEKDLSTVAYHVEPTSSTLRTQFQSTLTTGLPIDKPRYATYVDATSTTREVVYPNIFSASSFEEYGNYLAQTEQSLGMSGALTSMFQNPGPGLQEGVKTAQDGQKIFTLIDANKARSFVEWKALSLEEKHQRVMTEYLNPDVDGYIDDSPQGYEAMYFVADGRSTYYTTDFSGDPPVNETDSVYNQLASGSMVFGDPVAGTSSDGKVDDTSKDIDGGSAPAGGKDCKGQTYSEPVPILDWFCAIKGWWKQTKETLKKPLGIDLSKPSEGNTFNNVVKTGSVMSSLEINVSKTLLQTRGDIADVTVTAKDKNGKVASDDHGSIVWLQVEGSSSSDSTKAQVVPDVNDLSDVTFHDGTGESDEADDSQNKKISKKGLFLSEGIAKFQIVSGDAKQPLVIRAYGYNDNGQIQSQNKTLSVNNVHLNVTPENPVLVAGSKDPISVDVSVVDEGGQVVDLSTDVEIKVDGPKDLVVSSKKISLNHGQGSFTLTAGNISGDIHLELNPGSPSVAPTKEDLVVAGGDPKSLAMTGSDTILTPGGLTGQDIHVDIVDTFGNAIKDQPVRYTVVTSGPIDVTGMHDVDSSASGYQIDTYADSLAFSVRSKQSPDVGTGVVQVTAELDDGTKLQTQGSVAVRNDLHLEMSANSVTLPADGGSQTLFTATLKDTSGHIVSYSGPVSFSLGSEHQALAGGMGQFASQAPDHFVGGKALVTVKSGKHSGNLFAYVDSLGLPSATASVAIQPLTPEKLVVTSSIKTLATKVGLSAATGPGNGGGAGNMAPAGTAANITISLFDSNGNLATNSAAATLTARITKDTQAYGYIRTSNGTLTNQTSLFSSQGSGVITVESRESPGPIHLVISSPGLGSTTLEILTHGRTGVGQISQFNPNVLYASVLGGPFGNVTEQNYLAGNLLFSGKTQAASAITTDPTPHHKMATLNPYGGISIADDTVTLRVNSSGYADPLRVDIMNDLGKTLMGSLIIKQQGAPQVVSSLSDIAGKAGVFVQKISTTPDTTNTSNNTNADISSTSLVSTPDGLSIRDNSTEIARVNTVGGIHISDSRVTLTVAQHEEGSTDTSKYLRIDVALSGTVIAKVQLGFDAVNTISLSSTLPTSLNDFGTGVWLVSNLKDGNISFESTYSNYSTSDAKGYSLVDLSKDATDKNDSIGSSYTSLEDAITSPGVGFVGNNKHMLLLAARNTVGESHLPYASEIGIVLGDPTVKLPGDNTVSQTGFTKDLGKSIYNGSTTAQVILPVDVNGDGKKDLLIGDEDGKIEYLQYTGGEARFTDRGVLIDVANGIRTGVVGDVNKDGYDDLLFAVKENCTKKDTCVDYYKNTGGFFVRENLGLAISPVDKVTSMRLADMNQDGWLDLVTGLTNGDVRIFMSQQGQFTKIGQLVGTFSGAGSVDLTVSVSLPGATGMPGSTDQYPDILAVPHGGTSSKTTYLMSNPSTTQGGNVTYTQLAAPAKPNQQQAIDDLTKGMKDSQNLDAMNLYKKETAKDENGNGVPDYLDMSSIGGIGDTLSSYQDKFNGIADSVANTVKKLRCGESCFPLPVNQAFLAPGLTNNNGTPGPFVDGIPVFGSSFPCSPYYSFWPPCDYKNIAMTFRIYVSPTLTGQVALSICSGGPYPVGGVATSSQCYVFAPNISVIPASLCKAISEKISGVVQGAQNFGTSIADKVGGGDGGNTVMIAGGGASNGTKDTTTIHDVSQLLGQYKAETNVSTNIRVPGFPQFITDWMDRQIEEVLNKLADLPDLYIMYPDLSSIGNAFVPQVPKGKLSGYTKFLAYLNSIPLISIEPKPLNIRIPALSPSQILKFQNDAQQWLVDFEAEIERVKNILKCDSGPTNPGTVNICKLLNVKVSGTVSAVQKLMKDLETLKKLPRKIAEYRMIETKYIGQLINYLQTVSTFVGGYVKRQQNRISQWLDIVKGIKSMLAQWQALVNLTLDYNTQCDSCKSERFSLFHVLVSLFVNIPSPPIIPFPKWPDIVLDFSRVEAGVHVSWPDLTFSPQQILLPTLPRVHIPVDINTPLINVDLDFGKFIPTIPQLPTIPDLPNLPDLPPLPVFKLPDLPPAPQIPGLGMFKGVDLQAHISALKKILVVVCLLKKGYITVPESNLKTQVEELTQRPLKPPLAIDLNAGLNVKYPEIKYDSVDQLIIRSKIKFELQTDFIYTFFKQFADKANAVTTDLVKGVNTGLQETVDAAGNVIKVGENAVQGASDAVNGAVGGAVKDVNGQVKKAINYAPPAEPLQYKIVAETTYVDPANLPQVHPDTSSNFIAENENGNNYIAGLQHALEQYLVDRGDGMSALPNGDTYSQQWIAQYGKRSLNSYLVQAGVNDAGSKARQYLAYTEPSGGSSSGDSNQDTTKLYENYATDTQTPVGIYIENKAMGNAEKLVEYTAEMNRDPKEFDADVDGDLDTDAIYSLGGDIYFKENKKSSSSDAFNQYISSSPRVADINDLLPIMPAVHGVNADYSQKDSVTVSWNEAVQSLGGRAQPAGYEIFFHDAFGSARKRYLYDDAAGKIPYDSSVTTDGLSKGQSHTITFPLEYGSTYFQIIPLDSDGHAGTSSSVTLLAPQLCGDNAAPLVSVGGNEGANGASERYVAISKTLMIDASTSLDVKSAITEYFIDTDTNVDTDKDGDPTNDRNIVQDSPIFTVGPFTKEQDTGIKVWATNAQGNSGGKAVIIHVFVPDIVLSGASLKDGSAYGHVSPTVPQMPFALVRQRSGNATVLGNYTTDDQGNFLIKGLSTEGKTVIKNAAGDIVAEYSGATGKVSILKDGYTATVNTDNINHLILIQVQDTKGTKLASFFEVPDSNTDAVIDDPSTEYTPVTVDALHGVHVKDTSLSDQYIFRNIAANDPKFFGGIEVVDTNSAKRVAVIDSSGHTYVLNQQISVMFEDIPDMPYLFDLKFNGNLIGQIYIASVYGKPVTVLDSKDFEPATPLDLPSDTPTTTIFTDVSLDSPIYDSIVSLEQNGIIEGYKENGKTVFKPDQLVSRAEYTKILLKSLCIEPRPEAYKAPSPFYDISSADPTPWYYSWVKESYLRKLVNGYLDQKHADGSTPFKPIAFISRAEATKIIVQALDMLGIVDYSKATADTSKIWYAKYFEVGKNVLPFLKKASKTPQAFIITNDEAVNPEYKITRGDFAVMAARVLKFSNCHPPIVKPPVVVAPPIPDGPNKTSQLPPGVYVYLPQCATCPCTSTLDHTGMLLPGDTIFAILSTKDHGVVYRKSNTVILSP
ncbi:MAG: FG-GAP-like repeat-containing protein [Candidatus Gracilibacteria bacterium]